MDMSLIAALITPSAGARLPPLSQGGAEEHHVEPKDAPRDLAAHGTTIPSICNMLMASTCVSSSPSFTSTPPGITTMRPSAFHPPPPKKRAITTAPKDDTRAEPAPPTPPPPPPGQQAHHPSADVAPVEAAPLFRTAILARAADGFFPANFWIHIAAREVEMTWDHTSALRYIILTSTRRCTLRGISKRLATFNTQNPMRCCCILSVVAAVPIHPSEPTNLIAERVYAARASQDRSPYYVWRANKAAPVLLPAPLPAPEPRPLTTTTSSISATPSSLVIHLNHVIHIPLPALREAMMLMTARP